MDLKTIKILNKVFDYIGIILGIFTMGLLIYDYGFKYPLHVKKTLVFLELFIGVGFFIIVLLSFWQSPYKRKFLENAPLDSLLSLVFFILIFFELILSIFSAEYSFFKITSNQFRFPVLFVQLYIFLNSIIAFTKSREKWLFYEITSSQIIILSFLMIIFVGSLLLMLPRCTYNGIYYVDALFISTSAVCVTGLSTVDIKTIFTYEGQVIIMTLIQIGGLGIVTLTSFVSLFIQKGFNLNDQVLVQEMLDEENFKSLTVIIRSIIIITFSFELLGALALYVSWADFGLSNFDRIFNALFHSVSAYCNAGFSNLAIGLESQGYSNHAPTLITIMLLIIIGGIGFYTIRDIYTRRTSKYDYKIGLTLHSKVVIISTIVLIFGGALLIWLCQFREWHHLPVKEQLLNAFFSSVTSRTAGFANLSMGKILIPTAMIIILLMYIGAAPNSTAGGIKVTTAVTLIASFVAYIRGKDRVEIGWNTIPLTVIRRSVIVFTGSITLCFSAVLLLSIADGDKPFFDLFFETVSAFGTVGLSRGITPNLSDYGKVILMTVMFLGRVGLFTMAVAVSQRKKQLLYSYPEENLIVG